MLAEIALILSYIADVLIILLGLEMAFLIWYFKESVTSIEFCGFVVKLKPKIRANQKYKHNKAHRPDAHEACGKDDQEK